MTTYYGQMWRKEHTCRVTYVFRCFFAMINRMIWVHYPSAGEKLGFFNSLLDGEQCNFL